jgi:hypothetical protein
MISNDILTKEELEALLTPEEFEAFKAEQNNRLEHELMLSPAHLLLALRELEDTIGRLTTRVQQLEQQLVQKTVQLEPENLLTVNQVIETALFEKPLFELDSRSIPLVSEEIYEAEVVQITQEEMSMLLFNDTVLSDESADVPSETLRSAAPAQESNLISRSARHRERKPSILSKLLK